MALESDKNLCFNCGRISSEENFRVDMLPEIEKIHGVEVAQWMYNAYARVRSVNYDHVLKRPCCTNCVEKYAKELQETNKEENKRQAELEIQWNKDLENKKVASGWLKIFKRR